MMKDYLRLVGQDLGDLSVANREHVLEGLAAQLDELAEAGLDPATVLGDPANYAQRLRDALREEAPADQAQWRVFGLPVETRGPLSAQVRSRTWDPTSTRLFVPRLFGAGWTLNMGALAVKLHLIRPDDVSDDVLARIPESRLRGAGLVPLVIAGATTVLLAGAWRFLPPTVASGFDARGRPRGQAPRWTLIGAAALGAVPAAWAVRRGSTVDDRLVRAASATSLAVVSTSVVVATLLQARRPQARWGLLVPAALPLAVAASLAVIVMPLRSGLHAAWRSLPEEPAAHGEPKELP